MNLPFLEFLYMVGVDILFLGAMLFVMMPFGIWRQAAFAVMKRNFIGYFSNPTGYVFLCLFVLLTSFAAFWPHEFFTTNLANFDQLNRFLPYIMLIFIPAITMSIWSEERRQGTDELLLTLPAHDFDIVIGKYFAAVLVFTVSLLFSQLSNYAVLISMTGGDLDSGLLFSTYLGYWFVGIAMVSIGMVASFLTNNLTVGFIFGVVFNAPLAFFSNADVIISNNQTVSRLFEWSLLQRFDPFGRGLISLASIFYFVGLAIIGIYLSLVLIGRRHWQGGKNGTSLFGHFALRTVFLVVTVIALVLIAQYSPARLLRLDVSRNQISTLAENTTSILKALDSERDADGKTLPPIMIDAYVGANIPSDFVKTRYDLVNLLREFEAMGGDRIRVNMHTNVEPYSKEAILAEKRFGIRPVPYLSKSRGAVRQEQVILGAAFTSGLEREVIPFLPYGAQTEYELIRSVLAVAREKQATIGFVQTDVFAAGGVVPLNDGRRIPIPPFGIVRELQKQYRVESVNLRDPLEIWAEKDPVKETTTNAFDISTSQDSPAQASPEASPFQYDVLVVVQPSKMSPTELTNLITAIKAGQPTVIFEDPAATQESMQGRVPGTEFPRQLPRGGSQESCRISQLWSELGIKIHGAIRPVRFEQNAPPQETFVSDLIWQQYNPYHQDRSLDIPERLVIDNANPASKAAQINTTHPATSGISELIFNFCGAFTPRPDGKYKIEPLVMALDAGSINGEDLRRAQGNEQTLDRARGSVNLEKNFVIAARISSKEDYRDVKPGDVNCVYVADVDLLSDEMLQLRNSPIRKGIEYRYQNIEFVLNLIDSLTNQSEFISIRNRRERYVTLRHVEATINELTKKVDDELQNYEKVQELQKSEQLAKARAQVKEVQNSVQDMMDQKQAGIEIDEKALEQKQKFLQQKIEGETERLTRLEEEMDNQRNEKLDSFRLESELEIQEIQRKYKLAAVLFPPIPPLLLGLFVFTRRRLREREGISKARRLK